MEPARDPPWAEHEKVYLLAEILRVGRIPPPVLYGLIRDYSISPQWTEIALPQGRSLRSCQMAYNEIAATYGDYRTRPQLPNPNPNPIMYSGSDIPKKRALQPEAAPPIGGRLLQPRPPHSFPGEFVQGPAYNMPPVGEPANKKKRGRPTKAEAQIRAEQAAARGEVYPPPRKARTSVTATDSLPQQPEARPHAETPPGSVPPAPAGAMTPQQQPQPEQGLESSSGKKKRNKPTPLELEKPHRTPSEMESPLAYGSADPSRSQAYSSFTPISAPLPSSTEPRDRDVRMEGVEESQQQPRTTTPRSFKDTVGI
ncbi:hypothetical protein BS50DRAFT_215225 [Corynespora cassiicola Philippines]|uniref:Uncharacterized protein n=1 Tax=Corynespora cassiicola Philippines TaxID=1448308 RepID=A0A2T2N4F9_CORCC|nr:hypothetical protein BS50DRAFT_215225 [Corynespora cassiicola Philippines]